MGAVVNATLGLGLFFAAALGSLVLPGTFQSVALVRVEAPGATNERVEPLLLSRRLAEITLDGDLLREFVKAQAKGEQDAARAAWALRRSIRFASADGRTFQISVDDTNPERAQTLCNLLARQAVAQGPKIHRVSTSAQLIAASSFPGWPAREQLWLLLMGGLVAALATSTAGLWRRAPSQGERRQPLEIESPAPPATESPAPPATEPVRAPSPAPQIAAQVPEPPRRTDPILPPASPGGMTTLPLAPPRSLTPLGTGAQPVSLRRSTLILGSPIAPRPLSPLPPKVTPTSIFRPSPLPPTPETGASQPQLGPPTGSTSSRPPPAAATKAPSSHPLDRSGARYSYVSTPVPARPEGRIALRSVSNHPDPTLQTDVHKPWRRQLFTLGVAQSFVTAVTSIGASRRQKARFALELALCLAETGHARILLVEADLAEPELQSLLAVKLLDGESIAQQIGKPPDRNRSWSLLKCKDSFHVLLQDSPTRPELILAEQFRDCVIELSGSYDFVVLNGPPTETGLIGMSFTGWVDGAVIVATDETSPGVAETKAAFGIKQFLRVYSTGPGVP